MQRLHARREQDGKNFSFTRPFAKTRPRLRFFFVHVPPGFFFLPASREQIPPFPLGPDCSFLFHTVSLFCSPCLLPLPSLAGNAGSMQDPGPRGDGLSCFLGAKNTKTSFCVNPNYITHGATQRAICRLLRKQGSSATARTAMRTVAVSLASFEFARRVHTSLCRLQSPHAQGSSLTEKVCML